jgi:hypothetical protein
MSETIKMKKLNSMSKMNGQIKRGRGSSAKLRGSTSDLYLKVIVGAEGTVKRTGSIGQKLGRKILTRSASKQAMRARGISALHMSQLNLAAPGRKNYMAADTAAASAGFNGNAVFNMPAPQAKEKPNVLLNAMHKIDNAPKIPRRNCSEVNLTDLDQLDEREQQGGPQDQQRGASDRTKDVSQASLLAPRMPRQHYDISVGRDSLDLDVPFETETTGATATGSSQQQAQCVHAPRMPQRNNSGQGLVQMGDNTMQVQVQPGQFLSLRGAEETWVHIQRDFYKPTACTSCSSELCCIADCDHVYCPLCRNTSVVDPTSQNGGGLGLGFTLQDLLQWEETRGASM